LKADLHVHTTNTDGSDSPEQVFKMAKENNIELLSITDHDTLVGRDEFSLLAKKYKLEYVPGIEVSAYDYGRSRSCHIVGLYVQTGCAELEFMIENVTRERQENSLIQIRLLQDLGYTISLKDFESFRGDKGIYKQHIMKVLMDRGYADALYGDFYYRMFKNNGPLELKINYPSHIDAVKALKKAGAIPVLAHPSLYDNFDSVGELVEAGLEGIEINYPSATDEDRSRIDIIAKQYHLKRSGGSDYHGSYSDHSEGTVGSHWIDWE
jgi:predicted metal-dependent phosphoesterase TrpH